MCRWLAGSHISLDSHEVSAFRLRGSLALAAMRSSVFRLGGHIAALVCYTVLVGQKTLVVHKALVEHIVLVRHKVLVGHIPLPGIMVCWALGLLGLLGTWPCRVLWLIGHLALQACWALGLAHLLDTWF